MNWHARLREPPDTASGIGEDAAYVILMINYYNFPTYAYHKTSNVDRTDRLRRERHASAENAPAITAPRSS